MSTNQGVNSIDRMRQDQILDNKPGVWAWVEPCSFYIGSSQSLFPIPMDILYTRNITFGSCQSPSLFLTSLQVSTLPLFNFVTYPLCFLTAFSSDVMSQLFSRERWGASDPKNPALYYSPLQFSIRIFAIRSNYV